MSRNGFNALTRCLHFTNLKTMDEATHPHPQLWKLWPVITRLNEAFLDQYVPEQDASVDETLLLFKRKLAWTKYLLLKRSRFGLKLFLFYESSSGYICNLIVYTGKGTVDVTGDEAMGTMVVKDLRAPFHDKGHTLTVDKCYNSPDLAGILLKRKTDIYETAFHGKKGMPPFKKTSLKKVNFARFDVENASPYMERQF
ncbi:hypothetical protein HPB48_003355 [Haemaphysalis longicornis]|uniref:PiggyBac transposable element-derived protein domain-containing protein n=1 Tax=Haemaphysalis longicornis TaxID=44386 RepID=A0A9J6GSS5_HAELO|nr:hypothetical protein HPB48_003355 [Haemaphysalis longicornis]